MLINRRTKIVATLGPSSCSEVLIGELIDGGVDVFRLNLSHGVYADHREWFERIRRVSSAKGQSVAVLADLCGPKIRVGQFPGGSMTLEEGTRVTVVSDPRLVGPSIIESHYPELAQDVKPGDRILLDDGNLELRVENVEDGRVRCLVVVGGQLKDHKGMNLPGVKLSTPSLTDKDRRDAKFAAELGVDLIALSFVRRATDVLELRELLKSCGRVVPIVSKIEKPEALLEMGAILDASDAIMVARGDLGVELPPERVPNIQEELVDAARARQRPVIIATQMLESMVTSARPTRAEVTDVANAVRSGADAVMLSGETASGSHPVAAVRMMDVVVRETESYLFAHGEFGTFDQYTPTTPNKADLHSLPLAVANAVAQLSRELAIRAVVVIAAEDPAVAVLSASRPAAPIIAVSSSLRTRALAHLSWGVKLPHRTDLDVSRPEELARSLVLAAGLAKSGDIVLLVRGFSDGSPTVTAVTV